MARRPTPEELQAQLDDWVARTVAKAPPPSPELIRTLSRLLHPPKSLADRGRSASPATGTDDER